MEKPVLVVMAAGMGSRYGGLKQLDPVGGHGQLILDYSLYDARRAGFETVVFVIKEEHKAAFCAGIARGLGCTDPVSSPTFSIVNVYRGPVTFAHFDMYRIRSEEDLYACSFYDYLDAGAAVAVEWSENIADFLEEPYIRVEIENLGGDERKITVMGAKQL